MYVQNVVPSLSLLVPEKVQWSAVVRQWKSRNNKPFAFSRTVLLQEVTINEPIRKEISL
ncbi:MAG: hypothetical protein H6Q52_3462 [Deltaproteobacteria bacterium]|nr:hypothetical protein [Deltaproteobacteria bacterium]